VDRFQYLILMGLCLLVTLPLEFVVGARVWRRPRRLALALSPAFAVFVAWDLWASSTGTWGFDERYTIGVTLPGGMAIEELVFFLVVPICGLLTLEAVRIILAGGPAWRRRDAHPAQVSEPKAPV
jgi:lycopene cyclase domain-containing protein